MSAEGQLQGKGQSQSRMQVDVWVDLICPWCYLGKHRFERALAAFPHRDQVKVVQRSFQLDPTMPRGKAGKQVEVLMRKYRMSEAQVRARQAHIEQLAQAEGLQLHLADTLTGNTFDAHRLVHLGRSHGVDGPLIERLYRAHFTELRSLFDTDSLVALAAEPGVGLDPEEVRAVLATDAYGDEVIADGRAAHTLGAGGVPFFVIQRDDGGRYGISGAQPTEVFATALARAWADAHPESTGTPLAPPTDIA
jgi:predicted DsbA family dithiol-disulfide isomerase